MNIALRDQNAEAAAIMHRLDRCPSCNCKESYDAFGDHDLTSLHNLPEAMRHGDYVICAECTLIYAQWRQRLESAEPYYSMFPALEKRGYVQYPPPENYRRSKGKVAEWIANECHGRGLISNDSAILHIRSDCGSIGPAIRKFAPDTRIVGYDYFPTNIRYANETGALDSQLLSPKGIKIDPDQKFDLILESHMFTHALQLLSELEACLAMLKPDGAMFVYNEIDYLETLRPGGRYFRLAPVVNYHKQLFTVNSLTRFFQKAGLHIIHTGRRKNTLTMILQRPKVSEQVSYKRASEKEVSQLRDKIARWGKYRNSWVNSAMEVKAVRASYKLLARKPRGLEPA